MTEAGELRPGEWLIETIESGWALRVRPSHVSWLSLFPRTLGQFAGFLFIAVLSISMLGSLIPPWDANAASAPLLAASLTLLTVVGIAIWWRTSPPPIVDQYREANSEQRIEIRAGKVDAPSGMFDVHHLSTLRLSGHGALPGRYTLVFRGAVVPDAVLLSWPGVPEQMAQEIRAAVLERAAGSC